ncbi:hypothetical protein [Fervidibacillus halotolerans]|uniref:Uncharacterized protein n=1 Tax=Fervidibacillus halotolerans TaxID=2980027 RepID=A0A9E8RYI5_9BACI|nr:hypothetical protein [Fervidibacillus halotolerans]WAA12871.1 hypothetical protein OE105_01615 [Fervidibacillus halotolerans]
MEEGQFAQGCILPKVQAAIFLSNRKKGRKGMMTSLEQGLVVLKGKAGTGITNE